MGELDRAWSRHTRRLAADPPYRRALTVALAAVATTLLPHPAIAAALGAWLAEPAHRPAPRWTDDEEDEGDPPWRGPRLWDSLG